MRQREKMDGREENDETYTGGGHVSSLVEESLARTEGKAGAGRRVGS